VTVELDAVQLRVLGSLLEKEMATPDYYPLTLNALLAACNQTTNRNPVLSLEAPAVNEALTDLRGQQLVRIVYSRSNRAEKFRHVLDETFRLEPPELAVLGVLLLRGPQTASEVRARTERMHRFESQEELDAVLDRLAGRDEALVRRLERQPGQKESRWTHLLGVGEVPAAAAAPSSAGPAAMGASGPEAAAGADRPAELEGRVGALETEVERLRADHDALAAKLRELLD
jgi:uncharacterized protein